MHEFKKGPHVLGVNSHILGLGLALLEHIDPSIHLKHTGSELQFALRKTLHDVLPILQQLHELGINKIQALAVGTEASQDCFRIGSLEVVRKPVE